MLDKSHIELTSEQLDEVYGGSAIKKSGRFDKKKGDFTASKNTKQPGILGRISDSENQDYANV